MVAWNSTLVELGAVLDQRNKEQTLGLEKESHKRTVPYTYRAGNGANGLKTWEVIKDKSKLCGC